MTHSMDCETVQNRNNEFITNLKEDWGFKHTETSESRELDSLTDDKLTSSTDSHN